MKTLAKLLYVEADEEVTDLVDRLRGLQDQEAVTFVVPDRARSLQSPMSFRLLKRYADAYGKHVNLISPDARLQALALESGFSAYPTLNAYESGAEVHRPGEASDGVPVAVGAAAVALEAPAGPPPAEPRVARTRTADVVSAPPKRAVRAESDGVGAKGPRDRRPFYIGGAAAALLALVLAILFVPTADARVTVTGTPLKTDLQLLGMQNPVSGTVDHFPTQVITSTASQTAQGTATGQKTIGAIPASGEVLFTWNCSGLFCDRGTAPIPAGVTVRTDDGKRYVTQKAVSVQAPHGTVTSPVKAVDPGAHGNTGAQTINSIENAHPSQLTVSNPSAVGGGADQRVATIIQQSDLDAVTQALSGVLNPKVQDDLNGKAKGKHMVGADQPKVQSSSDHQLGDEVPNFNMTMTVTATGVIFDNTAVTKLLHDALMRKVPVGSQLLSDQEKTSYDLAQATTDGNVTLNGHASGYTGIVFSQPAMRAHMKGTSPSNARAFLQSLPNVVDVTLRQDPIALPWLPFFSSHITIHIQEVTGTATS
jgi:hypothetical protein